MKQTLLEDKRERLQDIADGIEDCLDDFVIMIENERSLISDEEGVKNKLYLFIHKLKEELYFWE